MRTSILSALAVLAGASASAGAAPPLVMFVFAPDGAVAPQGPCGAPKARDAKTLTLKREITQVPGLPPVMTECIVPAGTPAKASSGMVVGLYQRIGEVRHPAVAPTAGAGDVPYTLVVLSNSSAGQDAEYNRWYDQDHIPAILRNPGFESGERFRLVASSAPLPHYGARYSFLSKDMDATMTEVRRRLTTGETPKSDSFDYATAINRYYADPH
jgi:hypothetical protein